MATVMALLWTVTSEQHSKLLFMSHGRRLRALTASNVTEALCRGTHGTSYIHPVHGTCLTLDVVADT